MSGRVRLALAAATGALLVGMSLAIAAAPAPDDRRSGFAYMSKETQAIQLDDAANPGMLWVLEGERLWKEKPGASRPSCSDCHQDARTSMKGVAARYPVYAPEQGRPLDLQGRINQCRERRQQTPPFEPESDGLLALTTYVAHQSRGMPISPPKDVRLERYRRAGEALYRQRQGQLNFSCAQCHDENPGRRLGGAPIPQAHPTGYPLYRLEWQGVGSLQRRLRSCLIGVRADPAPYGADDYVNLEVFLMDRAKGMPLETPAVRP